MKTRWLVTTKVHIGLQLHRLAGVSDVQSHWAPVNGCLQITSHGPIVAKVGEEVARGLHLMLMSWAKSDVCHFSS